MEHVALIKTVSMMLNASDDAYDKCGNSKYQISPAPVKTHHELFRLVDEYPPANSMTSYPKEHFIS